MALTPAERMKRYREKLKNDPDRLERVKKKHADYVKSKSKKIQDLTLEEQEKRRKQWRSLKRKQKDRKQNVEIQGKKDLKKKSKTKNRNNRRLLKNYNAATEKIEKLQRAIYVYRKKLYRQRKETEQTIQKLEEQILKLKARGEILETTIKSAYKKTQNYKEQRTFKKMVEDPKKIVKKAYVKKLLGLKGLPRMKTTSPKIKHVRKEIEEFYLRNDVSRMTAGKKECRTFNKKKEQIRYLIDTISELHSLYKKQGGKYSLSTFYKYKPYYVISPNVQNRETCLCIKHSNNEMLLMAMKKYKILQNFRTVMDVVKHLCCDTRSKECMYGECNACKNKTINYMEMDNTAEDKVEWKQWAVVNHTYSKIEKKSTKDVTTKKNC